LKFSQNASSDIASVSCTRGQEKFCAPTNKNSRVWSEKYKVHFVIFWQR